MKQLTASKKRKLLSEIKKYRRKYLGGKYSEADESATRLMINDFLTGMLGFIALDEVKTEYMIRGAYADYVIQIKGKQHFVVEVKAMPIALSPKHLRQVVNYAANEGIEWALLTNGRQFEFYKVIFEKPINALKVFSLDVSDEKQLKNAVDHLQFLTRSLIQAKGLDCLWNRCSALNPVNLCRFLYSAKIVGYLKRQLKKVYKNKFTEGEIENALTRIIEDKIESVKPRRERSKRKKNRVKSVVGSAGSSVAQEVSIESGVSAH